MKTILSIGIPVYNGANTISETLISITQQLECGVEIVVSDNKSTDNTLHIVKSLAIKYPSIKLFENDINLGVDANIDQVVKRSSGEYVWLLGSDDEIANGGIRTVLDLINKKKCYASIFVNYGLYDRLTDACLVERVLNIKSDIECPTSSEFLEVVTIYPNFLSSIIVNRNLWININPKKYMGSYWLQFGMMMELTGGRSAYCVANPYVQNKGVYSDGPNVANRNGVALGILLNLIEILSDLNPSFYRPKTIKRAVDEAYKLIPSKISTSKRNGLKLSFPLLNRLKSQFGGRISFWIRDIVLLLTPRLVHWILWKTYKIRFVNKFYWKYIR